MASKLLLLIVLLSGCSAVDDDFIEWCREYGKEYGSRDEEETAYKNYLSNIKRVGALNKLYKERDVEFKLNKFADLSEDDFKRYILMHPRQSPKVIQNLVKTPRESIKDIPDTYDWRDCGVVTEVKNQGTAGTCWAFSTCANIEGQWALAGNKLISLSPEQLVDCDGSQDTINGNADCGVFGGWPYLAYQYVSKAGGLESWEDYGYCSGNGKCFPCPAPGYNKTLCGPPALYCNKTQSCAAKLQQSKFVSGLKVKSYVTIEKNETIMQAELYHRGPLSILMNAAELQFYRRGIHDPILCDPSNLDHAVLLVGYGMEETIFKQEKPYWLIKNSWGEKWGEQGYFRMIRGKGKCGVDQAVTSAILD